MQGDRDQAAVKLQEIVLSAEGAEQSYQHTGDRATYHSGYPIRQLKTRVRSLTLHIPKFRI